MSRLLLQNRIQKSVLTFVLTIVFFGVAVWVHAATVNVYPDAIDGSDTAEGFLADITADDASCDPDIQSAFTNSDGCYTVDKSDIMRFSSFDTSEIVEGSVINGVVLHTEWGGEDGGAMTNNMRYLDDTATLQSLLIQPYDRTGWGTYSYDIYANDSTSVDTLAEITAMDIEYTNNDGGGADAINFDYIYMAIDYDAPTTTISGTVYSDQGSTAITSGPTIKLVIGTSTPGVRTTTANGSGVYTFNDVPVESLRQPVAVFVDNNAVDAYTMTVLASTTESVTDLDLYQDHVIVRHQSEAENISAVDLAIYDSADDSDVPFTATSTATTSSITINNGASFYIWSDSTYTPDVTTTDWSLYGNWDPNDVAVMDGAEEVFVQGDYAYVTGVIMDGISIVDISDPSNPVTASTWDPGDTAVMDGADGIFVVDDLAYVVGNTSENLVILDVSSSTNPTLLGEWDPDDIDLLEGGEHVQVVGDYAYITGLPSVATSSQLTVLDVSSSTNPVLTGTWRPNSDTETVVSGQYSFDIQGNYAYVSSYGGDVVAVVDISDPSAPTTTAIWDPNDTNIMDAADGIVADGDYLYVSGWLSSNLVIIDISDPTAPTTTAIWDPNDTAVINLANWVVKEGDLVFVSGYSSDTVVAVDVSSSTNPTLYKTYTSPDLATLEEPDGMMVQGDYLYVTGYVSDNLLALDIRDAYDDLTLTGDFENNGIFDIRDETVTFSGTSQQTATGTMVGTSAFGNLEITNISGSGGASQSVIFGASASTTGAFILAASSSAQFTAGEAYTFESIDWAGTTASPIYLRSSSDGTAWNLDVVTQTAVEYVDVQDSDATLTSGGIRTTTSVNSGNNTNWDFAQVEISGSLYSDEGITKITDPKTIALAVGTSTVSIQTTTSSGGDYSFVVSNVDVIANETPFTLWVDGDSVDAALVSIIESTSTSQTGRDLYQNFVRVSHTASSTGISASALSNYDGNDDADIQFTVSESTGEFTINAGHELLVDSGTTFLAGSALVDNLTASSSWTPGDTNILDYPESSKLAGDFLYTVGLNSNTMTIVDVSSSTNPVYMGVWDPNDTAVMDAPRGIDVVGDYAYITGGLSDTLAIIDISSSTNPVRVGLYDPNDTAVFDEPYKLKVVDGIAYVPGYTSDNFLLIDVSSSTNPTLAANYDPNDLNEISQPYSVDVVGGVAYISSASADSLVILDVSSSTNPILEANWDPNDNSIIDRPYIADVVDGIAYIPGAICDCVAVVDVSSSTNPVYLSTWNAGDREISYTMDAPYEVVVRDQVAYVGSTLSDNVVMLNVASSTNLQFIGSSQPFDINAPSATSSIYYDGIRDIEISDTGVAYVSSANIDAVGILDLQLLSSTTINGDYTNNGVTDWNDAGTTTFSGTSLQTASGTMAGTSELNNVVITNVSGTDAQSAPSVIFGATASSAGNLSIDTPGVMVQFQAGATTTFQNVNLTGSTTDYVYIYSSVDGTQINIDVVGTTTADYVYFTDVSACSSQSGDISTTNSVSSDGNNSCINGLELAGIIISGTLYDSAGSPVTTADKTIVAGVGTSTLSRHSATSDGLGNFSITVETSSIGSWATTTTGGSNSAQGSAFGNGVHVMVADGGRIPYSYDGINWTNNTVLGGDNNLTEVIYAGGKFVGTSYGTDGEQFYYSYDGINWTGINVFGDDDQWEGLAYGDGTYVAVSSLNDYSAYSYDGINWATTSATLNGWRKVTYGNGTFVAVATWGGTDVRTSDDGITWTNRTSSDSGDWQAVTFGDGVFVAVSSNATNRVMTSADGVTWTGRSALGNDDTWYGITYANGMFVAVGDCTSGQDCAMYSTDRGVTWSALNLDENNWRTVSYGAGKFIAGAYWTAGQDFRRAYADAGFGDSTPITLFVDGDSVDASTITYGINAGTTTISGISLKQDTVTLQHSSSSGSIDLSDADFYDAEDDADILFTATTSTSTITADLVINSNTTLYAPQNLDVAGDFVNNGAYDDSEGTLILSGTSKTISGTLTAASSLGDVQVDGSYTASNNASTSDLTISSGGSFTAPTLLTIGGDYTNSGTFTAGTNLFFSPTSTQSISGTLTGTSALGSVTVVGPATTTILSTASTSDLTINSGTVLVSPATTLDIAGNYTNNGTYDDNGGVLVFSDAGSPKTLSGTLTGGSELGDVQVAGLYTFSSNASTTDLIISSGGSLTAPSKLTVAGSLDNDGTFTNSGGEVFLTAAKKSVDVSTAHFFDNFSVFAQENQPTALSMSEDGTKMFVAGLAGEDINEYTLSTAWDVSTASFVDSFSVSGQDTSPGGLAFSVDGMKMFVAGDDGNDINEYTLSTAWDVSTASFVDSFSVSGQDTNLGGLAFSTDGLKMFVLGSTGDDVNEYTLNTAWDVSTASFVDSFSVAAQDTSPEGLGFANGGKKMFVVGVNNDNINEYTLSTAWDVSTASFVDSFGISEDLNPDDPFFSSDGSKMYILGYTSDRVSEYNLLGNNLSGTFTGSSALNNVSKVGSTTFTFNAIASTSDLSIGAGSNLKASSSVVDISGDYTNNGIFTASTSEVIFSGTAQQTATGTMIGASAFYDLKISNTSQNGTTSRSVIFGAAASSTGTFTMLASTSAGFASGATSTFTNLALNGTAEAPVWLYSTATGTDWSIVASGTATITYVNVQDSSACGSLGGGLESYYGVDVGNNTCWTINIPSIIVSGSLYSDQGVTAVTTGPTIKLVIGTTTPVTYSAVANGSGVYTFSAVEEVDLSVDVPIMAFVDASTTMRAAVVSKLASTTADISGLNLYQDHVIVRQEGSTSTDAADMAAYDSADDADLQYTASSTLDELTILNSQNFYIWPGDTFVNAASSTFTGGFENAGGEFDHAHGLATFSGSGQTIFGSTTATSSLGDVTFSGTYTFSDSASTTNLTIASGGSLTTNADLTIDGSFANSGSFAYGGGADTIDLDAYSNVDYVDVANVDTDYLSQESVTSFAPLLRDVDFSATGTYMYVVDSGTGDYVYQRHLSTAWDPSTQTAVTSTSTEAQDGTAVSLYLTDDGSKMFIVGAQNDSVYRYDLGTPWMVSSAAYVHATSVSAQDASPYGVTFSEDGTAMYVTGDVGNSVYQYSLSPAWDLSSATYVHSTSSITTQPRGLDFDPSGSKLYVFGDSSDRVHELILGTPWDISTAVNNGYVDLGSFIAYGFAVADNGDYIYTTHPSGSFDYVNQYGMNPAHSGDFVDVNALGSVNLRGNKHTFSSAASTTNMTVATGTGVTLSSSVTSIAGDLTVSGSLDGNDGTLELTGTGKVATGILTSLANVTVAGSYTFGANATTSDLTISSGGSFTAPAEITVNGSFTNNGTFNANLGQVTLVGSPQLDISASSFTASTSVSGEDVTPQDVVLSSDGVKMYILGGAGADVNEYDLATPWDVTTASFVHATSVAGTPISLSFAADGTTMQVGDGSGTYLVYEYSLATPWDVSTAALLGTLNVFNSAESSSPDGLAWSNDGTSFFVVGVANGGGSRFIAKKTTATPWQASSGTGVSTQLTIGGEKTGLGFSNDGIKMYVLDDAFSADEIDEYTLSTAWSPSTASYVDSYSVGEGDIDLRGMYMSDSLAKFYVVGNDGDKVYAYDTSFISGTERTVSGTLVGSSAFNNLVVDGDYAISDHASTTDLVNNQSVILTAGKDLDLDGDYTNSGALMASTSEVIFSGTAQQTATGTMTGGSKFYDVTVLNTSQDGETNQSVIFGDDVTASGTLKMIASTSAQFAAGATSTFQNVDWKGSDGSKVWLRSSSDGNEWYLDIPGSQLNVSYVDVKDSNAAPTSGGVTATSSTDSGNNTNWVITASVTNLGSASTTDPASFTIAPGSTATVTNAFTLKTDSDTDVITNITLAHSNASSTALIEIVSNDGATVYGSTTQASGTSTTITLDENTLTANTTETTYKIRMTPKSHANLPSGNRGELISFAATVLEWGTTNGNTATGTDTTFVVTIDNQSLPSFGFENSASTSFETKVDYGAGSFGRDPAVSDFNNDGYADLAVAVAGGADSASIFINDGDGTFAAKVDYGVGDNPESIAASDLNNDGFIDLMTPNYSDNALSVLLNDGDGTFAAKVDYGVGSIPTYATAADLNNDGYQDVLVTNRSDANVSILFNDGDGTFDNSSTTYTTGSNPYSVVAIDLNNDGHKDLAVSFTAGVPDGVSVLINNGDGTFATKVDYESGGNPYSVAAADFNNDDYIDLVTANYGDNNLSVLLNDGDGTFATKVDYAIGLQPQSVYSADINNDGYADLAAVFSGGSPDGVSVLLNDGDGTFATRIDYDNNVNPYGIAVDDFDNDGYVDLVSVNNSSYNASVFINNATSTLTATTTGAAAGEVIINYTTPPQDDLDSIVILRSTSAVTDAPVDGTTYTGGETIGSATVACVDSSVSTSTADSCTATGLTNGTPYYFSAFVKDAYGNYSFGVQATGSPATPVSGSADVWNATDWTSYVEINIDPTNIDTTLYDFPVYVDLADLGDSFWSGVSDGGGDIRVTTAAPLSVTEVPREVVSASTTLKTGELHFKAPQLQKDIETVFRVYYNGTDSDYATDAIYGAENVWNDYVVVWHMNESAQPDSAGNLPDSILTGDFRDPSLDGNGNLDFDANDEIDVHSTDEGAGAQEGQYADWSAMLHWEAQSTSGFGHFGQHTGSKFLVSGIDLSTGSTTVRSGAASAYTFNTGNEGAGKYLLHATYNDAASEISLYSNGSLVGTTTGADPSLEWDGWEVYRVYDIQYESRGSKQAFSAARVKAEWVNFATTTDFYSTTSNATTITLSDSDGAQVDNTFSFNNKTDTEFFAFKLTPSASTQVTELVLGLEGVKNVDVADIPNIELYTDVNDNATYDSGTDTLIGSGSVSIDGQRGTITLATDFTVSAATNYLVIGDTDSIANGARVVFTLLNKNIESSSAVSGGVSSIQHRRNNSGGGGGGSASIGGGAPVGDGDVGGGESGGGSEIDTNTGGATIGNASGFFWPTAAANSSWNNPSNVYDQTDGTYATTSASNSNDFTTYNDSVPGGDSVQGIEVKLEISGTTAAGDIGVQLSWDGGSSWTSSKTTPTLTTTDAVVTVGGASDNWGRSWSAGEFTNANFSVRLTGNPSSNEIRVDALQVKVYHQASGGGGGGGGAI